MKMTWLRMIVVPGLCLGMATGFGMTLHYRQQCLKLGEIIEELNAKKKNVETEPDPEQPEQVEQVERQMVIVTNWMVATNWVAPTNAPASDALQAELAKLRRELEEKEAALAEARRRPDGRSSRTNFWQRMENLKETDPERYAEMQKRREEFQTHVQDRFADQSSFLLNLDASTMSAESAKNHEQLIALLAENWDLFNKMQDPNTEDRRALVERMREIRGSMDDMLRIEREMVLQNYGAHMGCSNAEAKEFSETIQYIFDMTSARGMLPRGPRSGFRSPPRSDQGGGRDR